MTQKKITVLGDIMCEPLLVRAAKKNNGYDFSGVFKNVRSLLSESDYVIGNLETPLAGPEAGYTHGLFSFNAPDEFADAIKNAGINMVLTANNHCIDRGVKGLLRTNQVLKEKGIPFAGTASSAEERNEASFFTVGDIRIAVVSYTYGTNYSANKLVLNDGEKYLVNLLRPQKELYYIPKVGVKRTFRQRVIRKILGFFDSEKRYHLRKALHMTVNSPQQDDHLNRETIEPFITQLQTDIRNAKGKSDLVIFAPHTGGQFNIEPGPFTEYVMKKAVEAGCDIIVASHPHVVQKFAAIDGKPCFYSLGNFSMSPNSVYLVHENLPEYGLAVHLYVGSGGIEKITFSILKILESRKRALTVYPVDELYEILETSEEREKLIRDVTRVFNIVKNDSMNVAPLDREYVIKQQG